MIHADPFEPFVICTDDGDHHVSHRERVTHAPGTRSAAVAAADGTIVEIDLASATAMTAAELAQQDADDIEAGRDGLDEIHRGESIPWEQVQSELGL
jgi:hypothetical protein